MGQLVLAFCVGAVGLICTTTLCTLATADVKVDSGSSNTRKLLYLKTDMS